MAKDLIEIETGIVHEDVIGIKFKTKEPYEMNDDELEEHVKCLHKHITYANFHTINKDISITILLGKDYKTMGIFTALVDMIDNYENRITGRHMDIMEHLEISKPTWTSYCKKLQDVDLIRILKYNKVTYVIINPLFLKKGRIINKLTFIAYQDIIEENLDKYVFEYLKRLHSDTCELIIKED